VIASPTAVVVNPNNKAQYAVLWGNGRIDAEGGAPPVTGNTTWYDKLDMPIGVALHVTSWTGTSLAGYVLDYHGQVHPFGGAPSLMADHDADSTTPEQMQGIPYNYARMYVDWSWDPSGSGQGYILDVFGELWPFGGAPVPPRTGRRWPWPIARRLRMQWGADKRAITMTMYGGLYGDFNAVIGAAPNSLDGLTANFDAMRDVVVTDFGTGSGHMLDLYGGVHEFGTAANSSGFPYNRGGDVARCLAVLNPTDPMRFLQVWSGGQTFEWVSSTPPSVTAGAGRSEVQTVTISGAPTGGSFTLTFDGATTGAISFDATAAAVQTALEGLATIGAGNVAVTGGPGPGTPWTVTFTGALAVTDVPQMTATSSLTGGTTPAVAVATSTAGITSSPAKTVTTTTRPDLTWEYSDPQSDSQAAAQALVFTQAFVDGRSMTDPLAWVSDAVVAREVAGPSARGIACPVDLGNDSYRLYVRVKDSAGQWSAWDDHGWAQNVAVPATPTGLTATADEADFSVLLSVTATAGSADFVRFEWADGDVWRPVRGADAVPLAATTTGRDRDAPLGVARTYRAVAYSTDPATASVPSGTVSATITTLTYVLTAVGDPTLGGEVGVQEPLDWSRPTVTGVFQGIGADFVTVVSDGAPKSRRTTLNLITESVEEWALVRGLAESDSALVYRDRFGEVMYCRLAGDWSRHRKPTPDQYLHTTSLPLVEVAPPYLAPRTVLGV
jgi:hypothetical protein